MTYTELLSLAASAITEALVRLEEARKAEQEETNAAFAAFAQNPPAGPNPNVGGRRDTLPAWGEVERALVKAREELSK